MSQQSLPINTGPISMSSELADPVTDADHQLGPANAPITLVEYGDYECPACLNSQPIIRELRERLGDQLRIVFRHFPRNSIYQRASATAEAAEAAAAQGRFWDMHELLFKHQQELAELDLTHLALKLGLDVYKFQRDGESSGSTRRIRNDYDGAIRSGVKRTPTFFINGRRHDGPNDFDSLYAAIKTVQ